MYKTNYIHSVIPIENRVLIISEIADNINNYQDCDVIADTLKDVKSSIFLSEIVENIIALINACMYRVGKNKEVLAMIKNLDEIKALL